MKEYEHMITAMEEVISHDVTGVVCLENYKGCSFPNAFRKVFDLFCDFREDYRLNKEKYLSEENKGIEFVKFQTRCREQRENLLKIFTKELESISPDINYQEEIRNYFLQLEQEDVQTQEMYLTIYPLLISMIRKEEEKVKVDET